MSTENKKSKGSIRRVFSFMALWKGNKRKNDKEKTTNSAPDASNKNLRSSPFTSAKPVLGVDGEGYGTVAMRSLDETNTMDFNGVEAREVSPSISSECSHEGSDCGNESPTSPRSPAECSLVDEAGVIVPEFHRLEMLLESQSSNETAASCRSMCSQCSVPGDAGTTNLRLSVVSASDEIFLIYLLGKCSNTNQWEAFILSFDQIMTAHELVEHLTQLQVHGLSIMRRLYAQFPRQGGFIALISEPVKQRSLTEVARTGKPLSKAEIIPKVINEVGESVSISNAKSNCSEKCHHDRMLSRSLDEEATANDVFFEHVISLLGLNVTKMEMLDNLRKFVEFLSRPRSSICSDPEIEKAMSSLLEKCNKEIDSYERMSRNSAAGSDDTDHDEASDNVPEKLPKISSISDNISTRMSPTRSSTVSSVDIIACADKTYKQNEDLFNIDPSLVAHCLTKSLWEDVYSKMQPKDLVDEQSPLMKEMIARHEAYAWWSVTCILQKSLETTERVARIVFLIRVASECRRIYNYHTLFGIVAGLSQPLMSWLWDFVKEGDKAKYALLERVASAKRDYLIYKADLSKCKEKCHIPFLGVTTKILTPIFMSVPVRSESNKHLINVSRCFLVQNTIDNYLAGQRYTYKMYCGRVSQLSDSAARSRVMSEEGSSNGCVTLVYNEQVISILQRSMQPDKIQTREVLDKISQQLKKRLATELVRQLEKSGFM